MIIIAAIAFITITKTKKQSPNLSKKSTIQLFYENFIL